MKVNSVNENNKHILKTAAAAGTVTTAITYLQNRDLVNASIANTLKGKDKFVSQAKTAAEETMKATGKTFDPATIAENAESLYQAFPNTLKSLGKSFLATTAVCAAGLFIGSAISDKIIEKRSQKQQPQE